LNTLNTGLQGPKENILTSIDKLLPFKNKILVWKKLTFEEEVLKCFSSYFRFRISEIIRKSFH
jgi:hypothetical protein